MGQQNEVRAELDSALAALKTTVAGVPADRWGRETANPGWTASMVLAHLISAESGNLSIARRILAGEGNPVEGFDLNRWNARQLEKMGPKEPDQSLRELEGVRQESLALYESLSEADLDRAGFRTTGEPTTVGGVFRQIARHQREHAEDIRNATAG
jgi:uncharacterized protein (TIGR03083 family)